MSTETEVTINDVPDKEIETTLRRALDDGATRVVVDKNHDGTVRVVATFPP